jgi:hypothetical protein
MQPRKAGSKMLKRFIASTILAALPSLPLAHAQDSVARVPGAVYDFDKKSERPAASPKRDISGIWEPAKGPGDAIQANGAKAMPSDGRPEHELPFTPEGLAAFTSHKPGFGTTAVPSAFINDPVDLCDPQGFPRIALHNFRTSQIIQTPNQVLILYEFNKKWRVVWTDGRKLPTDPATTEPRWWGYSVGSWTDDYTFVVESTGFDDRTWLDNAGRPHSNAMRVKETYRRVDADHLEMTIVIDDPKFYTKPWVALDKLSLRLQAPTFDIREMECSPSETAEYNQQFGDRASGVKK